MQSTRGRFAEPEEIAESVLFLASAQQRSLRGLCFAGGGLALQMWIGQIVDPANSRSGTNSRSGQDSAARSRSKEVVIARLILSQVG